MEVRYMSQFLPAVQNTLLLEEDYYTDKEHADISHRLGLSLSDVAEAETLGIVPRGTSLQSLSRNQAIDIYREIYWFGYPNLGKIEDQNLVNKIFDSIITVNGFYAIRLLQKAINLSTNRVLDENGDLNSYTVSSINNTDNKLLLDEYRNVLCDFHCKTAEDDPNERIFIVKDLARARR